MQSLFCLLYCLGSSLDFISSTTISNITDSNIVSQRGRFDMDLTCERVSVGDTLAMGVFISFLYLPGQTPVLIQVLIISAKGAQ